MTGTCPSRLTRDTKHPNSPVSVREYSVSHERAEQPPTERSVLISGGSMGGLATEHPTVSHPVYERLARIDYDEFERASVSHPVGRCRTVEARGDGVHDTERH